MYTDLPVTFDNLWIGFSLYHVRQQKSLVREIRPVPSPKGHGPAPAGGSCGKWVSLNINYVDKSLVKVTVSHTPKLVDVYCIELHLTPIQCTKGSTVKRFPGPG